MSYSTCQPANSFQFDSALLDLVVELGQVRGSTRGAVSGRGSQESPGNAPGCVSEIHRTGLGFDIDQVAVEDWVREPQRFGALAEAVRTEFPGIRILGMSLRDSRTAGFNHWGGLLAADGVVHVGRFHRYRAATVQSTQRFCPLARWRRVLSPNLAGGD